MSETSLAGPGTAGAGQLRRPVPQPDEVSRGFWDAAEQGVLAIQRCRGCATFQHPPRRLCQSCGGTDLAFEPVSGKGRLATWTVTHQRVLDGFEPAIPYTCMVVELAEQEQLYILSDLAGREHLRERLRIGMPMQAVFPRSGDKGPVLPQFEPGEG